MHRRAGGGRHVGGMQAEMDKVLVQEVRTGVLNFYTKRWDLRGGEERLLLAVPRTSQRSLLYRAHSYMSSAVERST